MEPGAPRRGVQAVRRRVRHHVRSGKLEAVAYRDGAELGRTFLRSTEGHAQLAVVPDRTRLRADDSDLSFIAIELRDTNGHLASALDVLVRVPVDGPAVLQVLGSAPPNT